MQFPAKQVYVAATLHDANIPFDIAKEFESFMDPNKPSPKRAVILDSKIHKSSFNNMLSSPATD